MNIAIAAGAPLISLNDGAGGRMQEGVTALAGFGWIFTRNTKSSGVIPQISVMLGPCGSGAAYAPALNDFVFMVRETSQMFITGPDVVKAVTGEQVSQDGLGRADVYAELSGVSHFTYGDEQTCLEDVRYLLSPLPQDNWEMPPGAVTVDPADRRCDDLFELVPTEGSQPCDMRAVLGWIIDEGEYMELHERRGTNVIIALAGVLDISASEKAARFVYQPPRRQAAVRASSHRSVTLCSHGLPWSTGVRRRVG